MSQLGAAAWWPPAQLSLSLHLIALRLNLLDSDLIYTHTWQRGN